MKASTRMAVGIALLALAVLPVAAQSAAALEQPNQTAPVVRQGDEVIVGAQGAALMVGQDVLARLSGGQKLSVTAVQGTWLGTSAKIGNATLRGWVQSADVTQSGASAPQVQLVARNCIARGQQSYDTGEWDYYWSGHHQPEPDLHRWEPWRYSPSTQAGSVCQGRQTSYDTGEWDYYWSGHHQPDPDLHR